MRPYVVGNRILSLSKMLSYDLIFRGVSDIGIDYIMFG